MKAAVGGTREQVGGGGAGRRDIWGSVKNGMLFLAVRWFKSPAKNKNFRKFLKQLPSADLKLHTRVTNIFSRREVINQREIYILPTL